MKFIIVATVLLVTPLRLCAGTLPDSLSYTVYSLGKKTGTSLIRIVESSPKLVLESVTEVDLGHIVYFIESRTVADPTTFVVEKFTWDRVRGEMTDSGELDFTSEGFTGWIEMSGERAARENGWKFDRFLTLEDYVFEHEILIALAFLASGESKDSWGMVFPSAMLDSPVTLEFVSDAEIESATKAILCRRLDVSIIGATPYSVFFAPELNLPVYMIFPAVGAEVFLDSFYGDQPISKWISEKSDSSSTDR